MCKLLILNTTMMWLLCSSLTTVHTCMVRSLPIHGMLTEGSRIPESRWTGRSRIEYTIQLWLSLGTGRGVVQSILGFRELNNRENGVPYQIWHHWFGGMVRGIQWAGGDPWMIGYLEYPLTRLILARSWCQNVLTEPGTRQRHSRVAVTDHKVNVF